MFYISIHAPHTGRDRLILEFFGIVSIFQSTRPIRGATCPFFCILCFAGISIHAPHTGRDNPFRFINIQRPGFQSTRPIRGATRAFFAKNKNKFIFQSTRPIRGATI